MFLVKVDLSRNPLAPYQRWQLTPGQKEIERMFLFAYKNEQEVILEDIVIAYSNSVRNRFRIPLQFDEKNKKLISEVSIINEYKKNSRIFRSKIKPVIMQWFKRNISSLIFKERFIIIPNEK